MNILKNDQVKEYISSLNGMRSCHRVSTNCQCVQKNLPLNAHSKDVESFSVNLAELILSGPQKNIRSLAIYISKNSFLDGKTMMILIHKMFNCKTEEEVEKYYSVLEQNLKTHPPCAPYMFNEYENLFLTLNENSVNMALWDYVLDLFTGIISGSSLYGEDQVFELAFNRIFNFSIYVLEFNDEVSKKYNLRPLIMKCLNFNPERRTRMSNTTKLIDKLFSTGYNFQVPLIHLAILVNQLLNR